MNSERDQRARMQELADGDQVPDDTDGLPQVPNSTIEDDGDGRS